MSIPDPDSLRPRVVTLGTAGGPRWWRGEQASRRTGIATAVVVGEAVYLVDCGHGVGRRMSEAGLEIRDLRGIFLTHLHSDHTVDLASLAIFGLYELLDRVGDPVQHPRPGQPRSAAAHLTQGHRRTRPTGPGVPDPRDPGDVRDPDARPRHGPQ